MDRDTILRLAREAGGFLGELPTGTAWMFFDEAYLLRFAALVAAHEREECAKVCDEYNDGRYANAADLCAAAIRSRT